jgi:predicted ATPase
MTNAPNNLPVARTSFVGRARELAELERLAGEAAIVTVTGTGGVGKTRLALELAHRLLGHFPAGVWLADLSPIPTVELALFALGVLVLAHPTWIPTVLALR